MLLSIDDVVAVRNDLSSLYCECDISRVREAVMGILFLVAAIVAVTESYKLSSTPRITTFQPSIIIISHIMSRSSHITHRRGQRGDSALSADTGDYSLPVEHIGKGLAIVVPDHLSSELVWKISRMKIENPGAYLPVTNVILRPSDDGLGTGCSA